MDDVETKLLSYPHLPADEQREVEAYVEAHPEWASLLRDVRALEGIAADVRDELPDDALVATFVVVQRMHPDAVPPSLQEAFSRLERRLEEDDVLAEQVEKARADLRTAEATIDPVRHFEALTNHSLEKSSEAAQADEGERDSRPSVLSVLEGALALPQLMRRGAIAVVVLLGLYAGLYAVSIGTQSSLERLATVDVSDNVIESYASTETRSATSPESSTVDRRYLEALETLRAARTSTVGLFPRYDGTMLNEAEEGFQQVLDQVTPGAFLALEARFYLAKIALAEEDVETARRHLEVVVKRGGRKRSEAKEILTALRKDTSGEEQ